jgi:hypothetical protein
VGNVYLAGQFAGSSDYQLTGLASAPRALTSNGGADGFFAKLNCGGLVASQAIGGALGGGANAVALDAAGNAYVTGSFQGSAFFPVRLTSAGGSDAVVVKFVVHSLAEWAKALGGAGAGADAGLGVASDGTNVYATGSFAGTADFDPGAGCRA